LPFGPSIVLASVITLLLHPVRAFPG